MSFGIGIGDIIAVSTIAVRVCTTIHQASSEQTALLHELEFFNHLVGVIGQRIASSDLPPSIARSTGHQLLQCQQLLHKLDAITTKYMARNRFRQVKWGIFKKDQVLKLLEDLRSLIYFLDVLLSKYTSETVQENTAVLKRIENRLPACLDEWAGCGAIFFIDALERRRVCSFELCDTWEAFQDFVSFSFRNSVGQNWVAAGKYVLSHEAGPGDIIHADAWKADIKPGMTVSMAMVLHEMQIASRVDNQCPACDGQIRKTVCHLGKRVQCKLCSTWFQLSSLDPIERTPGVNASLKQRTVGQAVGPDSPADQVQVCMFRRWNIQMRYGYLEGLIADTEDTRPARLELLEVDEPV